MRSFVKAFARKHNGLPPNNVLTLAPAFVEADPLAHSLCWTGRRRAMPKRSVSFAAFMKRLWCARL